MKRLVLKRVQCASHYDGIPLVIVKWTPSFAYVGLCTDIGRGSQRYDSFVVYRLEHTQLQRFRRGLIDARTMQLTATRCYRARHYFNGEVHCAAAPGHRRRGLCGPGLWDPQTFEAQNRAMKAEPFKPQAVRGRNSMASRARHYS
ncbi:hypothetical protein F6X40_27430 [Paraburkholderia sp. UCT31]|uniref:hypothetical protein n=1 Tax=Paraburkholderia sp. UCT31 TaxID=2615209 RepID=UPI001655C2E1|nr:hypothetical protein [Paraburkholderia sp. UCT31]MBC8740393.1 hypothetical protein [Paraburkholderia sp. UCT31]